MPDDHVNPLSAAIEPGAMIGPYRIAGVIADGPTGTLYEAVETSTDRRVALRHLHDRIGHDDAAREKFMKSVCKGLKHANVIAVEGIESQGDDQFLVMEFVGGRPAGTPGTRMPWRLATRFVRDAARGLAAIHNAGLVHGQIIPRHLIITHDGAAKLADLGLAGLDETPVNPDSAAPELVHGQPADARTDLYALGATYFTLLTGRPPFADAGNTIDVYDAILHCPVPTVGAGVPDMPIRCDVIVQKAMAKDPPARYESAEEFLADLDTMLADDEPRRRITLPKLPPRRPYWRRPAALAGALILLVGLAAWAWRVYGPYLQPPATNSAARPEETALPTVTNSLGMVLARVPIGRFLMGDPLIHDARPPHPVRITRPFLIGIAEVTQAQYQQVVGEIPSEFANDLRPVENVTWNEAVAFCEKLSARAAEQAAGRVYRLPTEAEWEFACRAGTGTAFSLGAVLSAEKANTVRSGLRATTEARTYPANPWGLFDVHGNVWEWCQDWYQIDYYLVAIAVDPTGPREGRLRVARGGSWETDPTDCRSASRGAFDPQARSPAVGFRVVCNVEGK
jgi:eukaryotic-like serine/threonine-protein kinase